MKNKLLLSGIFLLTTLSLFAQNDTTLIKYDADNNKVLPENLGKTQLLIEPDSSLYTSWEDLKKLDGTKIGNITIDINNKTKSIQFTPEAQGVLGTIETLYFCDGLFKGEECKKDKTKKNDDDFKNVVEIPIPLFQKSNTDEREISDKNRYFIIDAGAALSKRNNNLYKINSDANTANITSTDLELTSVLPIGGTITVWLENYGQGFDNITVNLSGEEFTFQNSLEDILNQTKALSTDDSGEDKEDENTDTDPEGAEATALTDVDNKIIAYLQRALNLFKEHNSLSSANIKRVQTYKKDIEENLLKQYDNDLPKEIAHAMYELLAWYPQFMDLTQLAPEIGNFDQVVISATVTEKDKTSKTTNLGTFYTSGKWANSVNTMIFISNLKNNAVYTEQETIDGNDELRAKMDEENNTSVGIGAVFEASYRTGSNLRPTINIGFFVPFEEEITPFFTLGPGISLSEKNLKLAASFGLTTGKITTISERYKDRDLSDVDDLSNLGVKIWKFGWYASIGVSFNL